MTEMALEDCVNFEELRVSKAIRKDEQCKERG